MPVPKKRSLEVAIRDRALDAVYYLYGDDDFRKEETLGRLIAAAVEPALRDFNLEERRGGDVDAPDLAALLSTPPMLADRRAVVIRDVGALKKDPRAALDHYLAHPASDTILLLAAVAGGKADRALQDQATTVEFAPLADAALTEWIAARAASLRATITPAASTLLVDAVGPDSAQLAAELEKLASYVAGSASDVTAPASIDEAAVEAIVGVTRDETLGTLLDRIADGDAPGALAILSHVLGQPKTTAVSIVMALGVQTLGLAYAVACLEQGMAPGRLNGELFGLLKETGAFPMRAWGEAVSAWVRAAPTWRSEALDDALDALVATDAALKETRVSSDEQILTGLILTLCTLATPARRAA